MEKYYLPFLAGLDMCQSTTVLGRELPRLPIIPQALSNQGVSSRHHFKKIKIKAPLREHTRARDHGTDGKPRAFLANVQWKRLLFASYRKGGESTRQHTHLHPQNMPTLQFKTRDHPAHSIVAEPDSLDWLAIYVYLSYSDGTLVHRQTSTQG